MTATEQAPVAAEMVRSPKIQARHLERLAVVYVRQSSPQQVIEHRESTALQYALKRRAIGWGWPAERVLVIDQDLGRSGTSIEGRPGFQQLLVEVGLDHVGIVLGIEMSRLARSCKDWHQLLEVCGVFGSLLADQDGLYDPRDYNDRLLLGLKGTLSEAELHILHQRMAEGRLNKARRGELFNHAPIGYVRVLTGELAMDPDEQVQAVVRLIFDKFDQLGSLNAVLQYLVRHGIRMGIRPHAGPERGQLQWRGPNRQTLRNLLHHPLYAGAYSWGRRAVDPRRKVPGRPATGRTVVRAEQCAVLLKDRCPAYITWERYQANRRRLAENQNRAHTAGPPREGPSLLAGLVVCGQCGYRMMVNYRSQPGRVRYSCSRQQIEYGLPRCQSLAGRVLDDLAGRLVLAVLEPASLELSIAAAADVQEERDRLRQHWQQRVQRACYEARRVERQYQLVEPENRLVCRELEKRWEQALGEQRQVEEAHDRFLREQPAELTHADREAINGLARDIPALWRSTQTTPADRQTIVRHLIDRVVVTAPGSTERADVTVHWAGGFTSQHELIRPVARYEQLRNFPQLMARVLELRDTGHTSPQIAEQLNAEGWRPPKRRTTFNAPMVRQLLSRHRRQGPRPSAMEAHQLTDGEWWLTDLVRELDMPQPTLYRWIRRGWVNAQQCSAAGGRWIVWADAEELDRLKRLRTCPRSWHNQPQAAELTKPKPRPSDS